MWRGVALGAVLGLVGGVGGGYLVVEASGCEQCHAAPTAILGMTAIGLTVGPTLGGAVGAMTSPRRAAP